VPSRAKRPCKFQNCQRLVESGYCELHEQKLAERRRQELNDDPFRPLYKNKRWQTTRLVVLARDSICKMCGLTASQVVDHVIPARQLVARYGVEAFYDESQLQGLCKSCHDTKTATEDSTFAGRHE
jgi:5-methylcytosine-specific restriction protein A